MPVAISFSGVIRMHVFVSLSPAARSIPWDFMPLNVLGSKFAIMIILLFFSSSFV